MIILDFWSFDVGRRNGRYTQRINRIFFLKNFIKADSATLLAKFRGSPVGWHQITHEKTINSLDSFLKT
jgi:hypothetical protein